MVIIYLEEVHTMKRTINDEKHTPMSGCSPSNIMAPLEAAFIPNHFSSSDRQTVYSQLKTTVFEIRNDTPGTYFYFFAWDSCSLNWLKASNDVVISRGHARKIEHVYTGAYVHT